MEAVAGSPPRCLPRLYLRGKGILCNPGKPVPGNLSVSCHDIQKPVGLLSCLGFGSREAPPVLAVPYAEVVQTESLGNSLFISPPVQENLGWASERQLAAAALQLVCLCCWSLPLLYFPHEFLGEEIGLVHMAWYIIQQFVDPLRLRHDRSACGSSYLPINRCNKVFLIYLSIHKHIIITLPWGRGLSLP